MNRSINPSTIGDYIKKGRSSKDLRLIEEKDDLVELVEWKEGFKPINPVSIEEGLRFEDEVYDKVLKNVEHRIKSWKDYDKQNENNKKIIKSIKEVQNGKHSSIALTQAKMSGEIGEFYVPGDADLILITKRNNATKIHIFDIKSAWEEKTHHRIQTAAYSILMEKIISESDIDFNYSIKTGIINKGQEDFTIDGLPEFVKDVYERDIKELLSKGGEIYKAYQKEDPLYSLDKKDDRNFEPKIYESLQQKDIRILGLTKGEQEAFHEVGLGTIEDIADIVKVIDELKPYNSDSTIIRDKYVSKVNKLEENHGLSKDITKISLKAKKMLDVLNPQSENALSNSEHIGKWDNIWVPGSGQGNLPEDSPQFDNGQDFKEGTMVRVYLNIQTDYVNDSIAGLSARATSSAIADEPEEVSITREKLKGEKSEVKEDELKTLEKFIAEVYHIINEVNNGSGDHSNKAPIHFYFWEELEVNKLIEILERHRNNSVMCKSFLNVLGQREGIEQKIYSVLQNEIRERLIPESFVDGPLTLSEELSPYEKNARFSPYGEDMVYERKDGTTVDLQDTFWTGLMQYSVPYTNDTGEFKLHYDTETSVDSDGYYCVLPRFNTQIPLEYLWGTEKHDLIEPNYTENPRYSGFIDSYRKDNHDERLRVEDYEAMMGKMCHALHNIERSIKYRNSNIEKKKMDLNDINNYEIGRSDLNEACLDYMRIEYQTSKNEYTNHHSRSIKQRVLSGKSVPIEIEKVMTTDRGKKIKGKLIYDELGFSDPDLGAKSCRLDVEEKTPWMLASPIMKKNHQWVDKIDSKRIIHSPVVVVDKMDKQEKTIEFSSTYSKGSSDDIYLEWHKRLGSDKYPLEEGEQYVLDPQVDDTISDRLRISLENSENNYVYNLLSQALENNYNKDTNMNRNILEEVVGWLEEQEGIITPNDKQKKFILNTDKLNVLQGPPGTGKTSGAISNSLLARLAETAKRKGKSRFLVSGASNKSIDEVLESVSEVLSKFNSQEDSFLENTELVRLTSSKPSFEERLNNVTYINHYEDEEKFNSLFDKFKNGSDQKELGDDYEKPSNIIVFTTPASFHNLASKHPIGDGAETLYNMGPEMFDLLLVDEASMMTLPQFINLGAFLSEDSQILISGDHRQMPPVQKHDWAEENRINIKEKVPFLSILDYVRFLRGDDLQILEENNMCESPELNIDIIGLDISYRCHKKVADLLNKWIYSEDNVDYTSNQTYNLPVEKTPTKPLEVIFEEEANIVLVTHNDYNNQQMSLTEGELSKEIIKNIPEEQTSGIVTPHNSQKGLLKSISDKDIQIDTVERYQGGEKDAMIVSATVSDLDYLKEESDFILSPNRLNVAISRMKKKLIIIAPNTIFRMMPNDNQQYNNSKLWKSIFDELSKEGVKWEGKLGDINSNLKRKDVEIKIYSK